MRRLHLLALVALVVVGAFASVSSAQAAPGDPFQYKTTFPTSVEPSYEAVAVNHETGNVLATAGGFVHQYDSSGKAVDFAAAGSPEVPGMTYLVVDNSGGPTQGNFYVFEGSSFRSYSAGGSPIGAGVNGPGWFVPSAEASSFELCGGGLTPDGDLWLLSTTGKLLGVTPAGVPTGEEAQLDLGSNGQILPSPCQIVFDGVGNAYTLIGGAVFARPELAKYDVESAFARYPESIEPPKAVHELSIDPGTDDLNYTEEQGSTNGIPGGWVRNVPVSDPFGNSSVQTNVTFDRGLLTAGGVGFTADGQTLYVSEANEIHVFHREPPPVPFGLKSLRVKAVRSQGAVLESSLTPGGAPTTFRFEYGTTTAYGGISVPFDVPFIYFETPVIGAVSGLLPNTTYHVRMAATNSAGTTYGPDRIFTTYPATPGGGVDPCPNALARKQTKAQALPDCRAYELVSAPDTGGYDVESYLAPGQTPFPGFPMATDRLLYATYSGAVPGPWNATNHGPDPYLATRTASGWVTDYKGLSADLNAEAGSFSSELGEADSQLNNLAFAGPNLCDPCFTGGGLRTGIPVRLASGQLVQGMTGSLAGSVPNTAKPEGKVAKYFSADGQRLIFASKYVFEPGANTGGDLTVYDRNLSTGTTQIVSTDESGDPLTGTVSELDVSDNGSRIVSAKQISLDSQGNAYTHPYMHIGSSPSSVDLAPGATSGVLFAGMTNDGSNVFFTTKDKLDAGDTDASADLYEAAVDGSGNLDLSVITETDSDACNPVANTNGEHWNTTDANVDCSAVAIAGGGGVASQSGAAYFLSPEAFGGEGTLNQPNLYLTQPGAAPSFVSTLEPNNPLVLDSVKANAVRRTGDFQTTTSGSYAVFSSTLALSGRSTYGFATVFRYDDAAAQIACASCELSETDESGIAGPSELAPNGLSLLDDGRVFFTTKAQLANNDANGRKDIYSFAGGTRLLISAGTGPFDSGLLTASADGTDVFFFTHDALAEEDTNGQLMKIYDARVGGGFFKLPASVPCQASDECHGPGTPPGVAPDIRSSGKTTTGNVLVCPKNRVKKRGHCVKKPAQRKHRKKAKKNAKKRDTKTTGKRGGGNA